MRIGYLQADLSINGRSSLRGRLLVHHLRREFEVVVGHWVTADAVDHPEHLPAERLLADAYDVLYLEGGVPLSLHSTSPWRVPPQVAEEFVRQGGVLVVADADVNHADHFRPAYELGGNLFGAGFDYGSGTATALYGADPVHNAGTDRTILCQPAEMSTATWLEPTLQGIDHLVVSLPAVLRVGRADILLTGNASTSGTLRSDCWVDRPWPFVFASVTQVGLGYVVLIGANFSHDVFVDQCPDNARWLSNLLRHLVDDVSREREMRDSSGATDRAAVGGRATLSLNEDDWSKALGEVATRRALIESRLRSTLDVRLSDVAESRGGQEYVLASITSSLTAARRAELSGVTFPDILQRLYWLELSQVVRRRWEHFQQVFGDRNDFLRHAEIVNERPDAHAKQLDRADLALHRRSLEWFERTLLQR